MKEEDEDEDEDEDEEQKQELELELAGASFGVLKNANSWQDALSGIGAIVMSYVCG